MKLLREIFCPNKKALERRTPSQVGIDNAMEIVVGAGHEWGSLIQITDAEQYKKFLERFGDPDIISEDRMGTEPIGKNGGSLFYDRQTGAPVAYSTFNNSLRRPVQESGFSFP